MIIYYNEYNKYKNNLYDELREYCLCERANEEHLRTLIHTDCHHIPQWISTLSLKVKLWPIDLK